MQDGIGVRSRRHLPVANIRRTAGLAPGRCGGPLSATLRDGTGFPEVPTRRRDMLREVDRSRSCRLAAVAARVTQWRKCRSAWTPGGSSPFSDRTAPATTIKMIAGLVRMDRADVRIAGESVRRRPGTAIRRIGAVLEGSRNLHWRLTPLENIDYWAGIRGVPRREARSRGMPPAPLRTRGQGVVHRPATESRHAGLGRLPDPRPFFGWFRSTGDNARAGTA
jgi:hypothetical protein